MFGKKKDTKPEPTKRAKIEMIMDGMTPAEEAFTRIFPSVVYDGFKKTMGALIASGVLKLDSVEELKAKNQKPPIDIEAVLASIYVAALRITSMDGMRDVEKSKAQLDETFATFAEEGSFLSVSKEEAEKLMKEGGCGEADCEACNTDTASASKDNTLTTSIPAGVTKH